MLEMHIIKIMHLNYLWLFFICKTIFTRTSNAKVFLGLTEKGHLGLGADADIAIYKTPGTMKREKRK
ncbi:hypothetical protein [Methanococcus aeolicus]|uniref:hypothetical protein n=1 Tax=Methanococcus aeolicus TaxID=42879 RepID=UPI0021C66CBA|nr:hypothetical protein [Methanococcus aeolicus]UXM85339.1 hypothetical protein N6C89_03430 [Methanococcus aeolicus]